LTSTLRAINPAMSRSAVSGEHFSILAQFDRELVCGALQSH
jgi:hypothetical protein